MSELSTGGPSGGGPDAVQVCYRHPNRQTGVTCSRCDRPICPECMVPASVGFQCPECVSEGRKTVRAPRTVYGGVVPRGGWNVTTALVALNVAIFVITVATGANLMDGSGHSTIYARFALRPPQAASGEWYRLFSSMFLHFGLLHIFFNMWALLVIGSPLEQMLGRVRFGVLYVLSGIGGGLLSMAFGPLYEFAAGASGAIFGLFGAFYVISRRRGLQTGPIVGLIAINLVFSFTFSGIDWRGHVGGLVVGALVAFALTAPAPGPNRNRLQALGCVVVALVLVASGFAAAHHVRTRCVDAGTALGQGSSSAPVDAGACHSAGLPIRPG